MTPIHISLDLETWGTRPGCDIRSIGACVFAPEARHGGSLVHDGSLGTIRPFYIACDNPVVDARKITGHWTGEKMRTYPLTRDPATVQWWSEQSEAAQAAFADPVDLRTALGRFTQWLTTVAPACGPSIAYDIRLWSHGPAFDPPILATAYAAVGLPVPWHYRAPRDTRTAFDMAGISDHSAWLAQHPGPLGIAHHSLDDSICQARAVCGAWGMVQRWRNTSNEDDGLVGYLSSIVEDIENDGDRAYFGSTNDADKLIEISNDLSSNWFERKYDEAGDAE